MNPQDIMESIREEFHRVRREGIQACLMPPKILVVDDNEDLLKTEREYFEALGYEVQTASNAEEAIEKVRQNRQFTHALLDLHFPKGESGVKIMKRIKEIEPTMRIKLVSGYLSAIPFEIAKDFGVSLEQKPIQLDELNEWIIDRD